MLDRMLEAVPRLPRPVVLLEDGRGGGTARLAWGARHRVTVPWDPAHVGDLSWLGDVARRGRAYGVLAYELGLPPGAARRTPAVAQPLAELFLPEHEVVADLDRGQVVGGDLEALGPGPARWPDDPVGGAEAVRLDRSFDRSAFVAAVERIKEYIAAGDVYQVNLALAERFRVTADAWSLYRRLRAVNPSPWMGFADFGDWQLVSGSPELLVEVMSRGTAGGRLVRTRPIAGTRKKTGDLARDAAMQSELVLDEKEQAEHRMLLDLARNDLGRIASFGSVEVSEREVVEEYSHVFHLVSEVVAELAPGREAWEVVPAVFPGGTITGAPKRRAMEIIGELEPVARGAYTGGLGWLDADALQLNIVIRSAVVREGVACVQAGAGIVWDSDPAREWRESLRKGAAMREVLGGGAPVRVR